MGAEGDGSFANDIAVPAHLNGRGHGGGACLKEAGDQALGGNHGGRTACGGGDHTVGEAGSACGGSDGDFCNGVVKRDGEGTGAGGTQFGQDERAVGAGRGRIEHACAAGDLGGG